MLFEIQDLWGQGQDLLSDFVHDTLTINICYLIILRIKSAVLFKKKKKKKGLKSKICIHSYRPAT